MNNNNPTNENTKSLQQDAVQQSSEEPLIRFFEDTTAEDNKDKADNAEEDAFFSPLPDIELPDETDDPTEDAEKTDVVGLVDDAEPSDGDAPTESDAIDEEAASDNATIFISEQSLANADSATKEAEGDDTIAEDTSDTKPRRKLGRIFGIVAGAVGGAVVLTFAVLCIILFRLSGPVTVDLDETVSLGALETHPILSALTTADPLPANIDTSALGEEQISLTFFGFLPRTLTVSVCDLTLPAVTAYRMTVGVGTVLAPDDCVLLCDDKTAVTHKFAEEPDTSSPGERTCLLLSTDAGGNTVQTEVTMTVSADACTLHAEFGSTAEEISALFADAYPSYQTFDLAVVDETVCGTYRVIAAAETERAVLALALADTTPPTGKAHSFNLLSGTTLTAEDFVTDIRDASDVVLTFENDPDFGSFAPQTVTLLAQDAHGNETRFSCALQVWSIANALTAECGTTLDALKTTLFADMTDTGAALPAFDASFDPAELAPGTYNIRLRGQYSTPTVALTMVDTTAPQLVLKPVTAYVGHTLTPEQLAETVVDATAVTLSFKTAPDMTKAGNLNVTVIAEDAGGNKTEAQTTVSVIVDTAPPQIYGVKTIYAQQNGTVSYRSGVSAYDTADGNVTVKVDASRVDVTKIGKYTVIYTATDKAGNTATHSALVYVTGANQASVDLYTDEILAVILKPGMTDTQKANAIYNWCVGHLRYSTSTSQLMGHFIEAAYSGFTKHIGNCYTYYAVASSLLTRAGIENIEIQRNNPNAPHYWNLVKIDGNWYHLDTCPKWKSHPIKTFLLTDSQVKHYSTYELEGYYSFDASRYPATP